MLVLRMQRISFVAHLMANIAFCRPMKELWYYGSVEKVQERNLYIDESKGMMDKNPKVLIAAKKLT